MFIVVVTHYVAFVILCVTGIVGLILSLKSVELETPKNVVGKNTYEAIQSGLILGHTSMIDSMIEKIILETGLSPRVLITGGLGKVIQPLLNIKSKFEENLTLDGLEEIYKLNN